MSAHEPLTATERRAGPKDRRKVKRWSCPACGSRRHGELERIPGPRRVAMRCHNPKVPKHQRHPHLGVCGVLDSRTLAPRRSVDHARPPAFHPRQLLGYILVAASIIVAATVIVLAARGWRP